MRSTKDTVPEFQFGIVKANLLSSHFNWTLNYLLQSKAEQYSTALEVGHLLWDILLLVWLLRHQPKIIGEPETKPSGRETEGRIKLSLLALHWWEECKSWPLMGCLLSEFLSSSFLSPLLMTPCDTQPVSEEKGKMYSWLDSRVIAGDVCQGESDVRLWHSGCSPLSLLSGRITWPKSTLNCLHHTLIHLML